MDNPCKECPQLNMAYIDDCEYGCDNPCEKAKEFYNSIGNKLDELLKAVKQDEELKKELYDFANNNPDRVFRGEKDFKG